MMSAGYATPTMVVPAIERLTLNVFGPPDIRFAGRALTLPTRKTQALLIYLAVEGGAHSRDALATLLWPDSDPEQGRAALRQTLAMLKKVITKVAPSFLLITRTDLAVQHTDAIDFDFHVVQSAWAALQTTQRTPHTQPLATAPDLQARIQAASVRYRGDFLAGLTIDDAPEFEQWVSLQREAWHQRMGQVFDHLSQFHLDNGAFVTTIDLTSRWIAHDPLHEPAYRRLMTMQATTGDRAAALRTYHACRKALATDLGVEPDAETESLIRRLLATTLHDSRTPPMLTPPQAKRKPTLPLPATRLIGRDDTLATIRQTLAAGARLLTLVGPPGVGKTRLAMAVAAELNATFPDGVWFIDLAPIRNSDLVPTALAQALGVPANTQPMLTDILTNYLRDFHGLLVFDNFEQVLAAAALLRTLLATCPHLRILVTSRRRLRLRWEHVVAPPPLTLPNLHGPLDIDTVMQSAAVQLFVERTRAGTPTFELNTENAPTIAQLVVRLDGLPLALELAAAHSTLLPPAALLARLTQRRPLPTNTIRDLPARHQTLESAIAISYNLLEPPAQRMFRRLAIFVGGWTLDSAEAIADSDLLGIGMVDVLAALVDQSLAQVEEQEDGTLRFVMLETLREYAQRQLAASGELLDMQQQHAQYFVDLAQQAKYHSGGADRSAWFEKVDRDIDNLRAVLTWAVEGGDIEAGMRLSDALWRFWESRGLLSEAQHWLDRILAREGGTPTLRAGALNSAGAIAHRQGNLSKARTLFTSALALRRSLGVQQDIASALNNLGMSLTSLGDYTQATTLLEESLAIKRALGDTNAVGSTLNNLGLMKLYQGEYQCAAVLFEEALGLWRTIGQSWCLIGALTNLGLTTVLQGRYHQAQSLFAESLQRASAERHRYLITECIEGLAMLSVSYGAWEHAIRLFGAAQHIREQINAPWSANDHRLFDSTLATAQIVLGADDYMREWNDGYALTEEQAITEAERVIQLR
jgi:predicted ATPase/DNA-binding SARP family transcriptional activator